MRGWPDGCIDHCIVDPPFNIGSGSGRKGKSGLGWAFSSHVTMDEEWDTFTKDEFFDFNVAWLRRSRARREAKRQHPRVRYLPQHLPARLHPAARSRAPRSSTPSIWFKPNAQPNITARTLTESTEQIIWAVNETPAKATGWTFNYWDAKEMNGGKQMRNLWEFPVTRRRSAPAASIRRRSRSRCSSAQCCWHRSRANCCSTRSAAPARSRVAAARSMAANGCSSRASAEYAEIARRRLRRGGLMGDFAARYAAPTPTARSRLHG